MSAKSSTNYSGQQSLQCYWYNYFTPAINNLRKWQDKDSHLCLPWHSLTMFLHSFKLVNSLFSVPLSYLFKGFVLVSSFFLVLHMKLIITRIVLPFFLQIFLKLLQEKILTFENYSYLLQVSNSGMQIIFTQSCYFLCEILCVSEHEFFFLKDYLLPFQKRYRFLSCSKYLRRYNCF